mgnify:CR=1 FL=1
MVSPAPTTPAPMRQSIPREQLVGALDRLQAARIGASEAGDDYSASMLTLPFARNLLTVGRLDEASAALVPATAFFRDKAMSPYLAHALELSAEIAEAAGREDEATAARTEAMGLRAVLHAAGHAQGMHA